MRIGIDHRPALHGHGGLGVYVRELVRALGAAFPTDRLELYGHRARGHVLPAGTRLPPGARLHRRRIPSPLLTAAAYLGLGADRLLGGVDVLHATDFVALRPSRAPLVASIHDVLFMDLPDGYASPQRRRLAAVTRRLVARAARLVVPCAQTARALERHFGAAPDRIDVVPLAPRPLPAPGPAPGLGRYVLFVGTLQPRKNLGRLLTAFDAVRCRHGDVRLVVVGGRGWLDEDLLAGMAARPHVVYTGVVDERRLHALYRGARLLAFPSLGEGFGFPVVEALAAGCPALVHRGTVCEDVAGRGGLAVDATDVDALAAGLTTLLEDEALRARLARAGPGRAAAFTWEATARATRAVYERVVAG